jgi:hypothetical protein
MTLREQYTTAEPLKRVKKAFAPRLHNNEGSPIPSVYGLITDPPYLRWTGNPSNDITFTRLSFELEFTSLT